MKRILCFLLSAFIMLMLVSCHKKPAEKTAQTDSKPSPSAVASEEKEETSSNQEIDTDETVTTETPDNETVATAETAPAVFWTGEDIYYHLEGCSELKEKANDQIAWQVVEQIMLRRCTVCNPPKYANYVENDE
ncbi:MAG: hypothetical protein E7403_05295 [Ruminococcaceae bacterium]|nr:hypothetical protein [Oscillospiraceae bacterium]